MVVINLIKLCLVLKFIKKQIIDVFKSILDVFKCILDVFKYTRRFLNRFLTFLKALSTFLNRFSTSSARYNLFYKSDVRFVNEAFINKSDVRFINRTGSQIGCKGCRPIYKSDGFTNRMQHIHYTNGPNGRHRQGPGTRQKRENPKNRNFLVLVLCYIMCLYMCCIRLISAIDGR